MTVLTTTIPNTDIPVSVDFGVHEEYTEPDKPMDVHPIVVLTIGHRDFVYCLYPEWGYGTTPDGDGFCL